MNKREFKMDSETTLKRITKQEAKKVFESGAPIWLAPCKVNPVGLMGRSFLCYEKLGTTTSNFESLIISFNYYNACSELGYYPAYYVKERKGISENA